MHDFWDKEQLLNHLAAFEVHQDECEVIIDEDGINILPTFRGYFIENSRNKETIKRINQIFRGYLLEQFAEYDLEYREILEANLDKLIEKAYENVGSDKEKMQQGTNRVTIGFLKDMLLELKDLVTVIGKTEPIIPPYLNEESKEKILTIFKNFTELQHSNVLSFNRDLFIPEVLIAEYLMKVARDFGFDDGELVKVPLLNRRGVVNPPKRKIINYRVTILPLWRDVLAYGLLPEGEQVPHLLLFCGPCFTQRPKARSFLKKLQSQCLGYFIYKMAEEVIENWLAEAESITNHKAILLGHGLGGALVGYTSTYLHPRVQKGMTFDGIEVDTKTTKIWHEMAEETERPVLHNFYLEENKAFHEMSHQMIGDNFDVLIDDATTQLDNKDKRPLGKDVVVCKRKAYLRSSTLTKISSSFIPIIGTCYHMAGLAWDWVATRLSAENSR